ncbi:MAG: hypothetical protein HGB17_02300 [Syntrophobacteraceae bacterium]|nr:hypothetical protein [Syntrophobacteraceae bacterium]
MKHPNCKFSSCELQEAGFALLEVLVALVVTGALLSVLLPAMTFSSERLSLVEQQSAARRLAAARLEVLQILRPEEATPSEGSEGELRWKMADGSAVSRDGAINHTFSGARPISVEITDSEGKSLVSLQTVRVAP